MTTTTAIANLKPHPAQMRTTYSLDGLAELCLQIYERGLHDWQPILASPNGEEGTFYIVSGHRRQMAQLLAFALGDWAEEHPETDISAELSRTMIEALVNSLGSLDKLIESLLARYGDREISFVPFDGGR